jgi:hypothetical protein
MKKDHLDPFPVFICAENGPNGIIACEIWGKLREGKVSGLEAPDKERKV